MLTATALAALLSSCAPNVSPDTMRAIVSVESGANPLAIGDNTTRRSYAPEDETKAKGIARILLRQGHSLDIGLAQVNNGNFPGYRVTANQMFDPCTNLQVASSILVNDYRHAAHVSSTPQAALWSAISAYNTGSLYAGAPYVAAVIRQAQALREVVVPTIDLLSPKITDVPAASPGPIIRPTRQISAAKPRPTQDEAHAALAAPLDVNRHTGFDCNMTVVSHGG